MGAAPQPRPALPAVQTAPATAPPDEIVVWARAQIRWERRLDRLRTVSRIQRLQAVDQPRP